MQLIILRKSLPLKTSWVCAFSTNILTIDIQTTSHNESVNGTFKRLLHNSNSTPVDVFLAVEEQLEEEQDYVNWHNTLSITQSTTIASNAFSDIISELKEFTTFPIQKIHYNEMKLLFGYDAKLLDRSCIINEDLKVRFQSMIMDIHLKYTYLITFYLPN
jgi:hypothetical protein